MIERINTVLRELHTQLVSEIANGRDAYFGPGFQEAVKAFSRLYLSGDVHLVLEKARQTSNRSENNTADDEFPDGFVRLELFAGGSFSAAVNAISAVRDLIDQRTSRPSGAMIYVAGVAQGAQVMSSAVDVLAMIAREQRKNATTEKEAPTQAKCRVCSHCGKPVTEAPESTEAHPVWECKPCNAYWTWLAPPPVQSRDTTKRSGGQ